MNKKNKRGGLRKKRIIAAAVVITLLPSIANGWYYDHWGTTRFGSLGSRPLRHMDLWGSRRYGFPHSGYLDSDIRRNMSLVSTTHSGYADDDYYWWPHDLKRRVTPRDAGRNDVARQYSQYPSRIFVVPSSRPSLVERMEAEEGPTSKEKVEARRAAVNYQRKRSQKARQTEGLDELGLFQSYFKNIGMDKEDYNLSVVRVSNQTVCVTANLLHYNTVIEWQHPELMGDILAERGYRGNYLRNHEKEIEQLNKQGVLVRKITGKDGNTITSQLDEIIARYSLAKKRP